MDLVRVFFLPSSAVLSLLFILSFLFLIWRQDNIIKIFFLPIFFTFRYLLMSFKCYKCHLNDFKSNGFDLKSMKEIEISLHLIVLVYDYLREVNRHLFLSSCFLVSQVTWVHSPCKNEAQILMIPPIRFSHTPLER